MRIFKPNIKKFKKEKDISSLIRTLYDKDYDTRDAAAKALGEIGDSRSVKELVIALKDKNRSMSMSAAKALGMIGQPAIESLLTCIHDENRNVRIAVLRALGIIGDKKTADQIAIFLKDKDIMVESEAAKSLSKIGDERGINALKEREKRAKVITASPSKKETNEEGLADKSFNSGEYFCTLKKCAIKLDWSETLGLICLEQVAEEGSCTSQDCRWAKVNRFAFGIKGGTYSGIQISSGNGMSKIAKEAAKSEGFDPIKRINA
jgi:hypothetical protein